MYQLWLTSNNQGSLQVKHLSDHATLPSAKESARRHGPGHYTVCNDRGNVARLIVRARRRSLA